jgi:Ca-activated chloride channel homolog
MAKRFIVLMMAAFLLVGNSLALAHYNPDSPQPSMPQGDDTFRQPVFIRSHTVDVEIRDQVAKTRITQVFVNNSERMAEGTYVFPLPQGVTISDLEMIIDGVPIQAEILERDEARRIYDEIVRQYRDPALLEYIGTNAIQASVFPIPANDTRTLEIEFNQLLPVENGLVQYVYPLRTRHISPLPVGQLNIRVDVESNDPIGPIYSPSHRIAVDRDGDTGFVASFETTNTTESTDFNLYYGIASDEINLNLLTYRESATEDGFFTLLLAPPVDIDEDRVIPKDVTIVLDQSGSMFGEKWEQAVAAAGYVLDNLNAEDRFNIVVFNSDARVYANSMQPPAEVREAKEWLRTLEPVGGTNIDAALRDALERLESNRQSVILFMTDGLATEGVTETSAILENLESYSNPNTRIFTFGVGDDVDTFLLDRISQDYSGASSYVRPDEPIDEEVASLYNKISLPVLTNLDLAFDGVTVYDLQPRELSDLFIGSQLVVVGRYSGDADNATVRLRGEIENEVQTFTYSNLEFRENAGGEELIPRLWATRKIGEMLNSIRLNGESPELVDSIVRLSIRYGIITPYTSFLITEDDIFSQTGRDRAVEEAGEMATELESNAVGASAVDAAEDAASLADADTAQSPPSAVSDGFAGSGEPTDGTGDTSLRSDEPLRYVGDRTFINQNGVWIDTLYDSDTMQLEEIVFLSDAYFELLDADDRVADFYALGEEVIFVLDGTAYSIVTE